MASDGCFAVLMTSLVVKSSLRRLSVLALEESLFVFMWMHFQSHFSEV